MIAHRLENDINSLAEKIMTNYEKRNDIDVIENFIHLNKDDIIKIIFQLRNIIFPGYYENKNFHTYTIKNNLTMNLEAVLYNLSIQILIALKYLPEYKEKKEIELLHEGEKLSLKFLEKLTKIQDLIQTDLQAAYDGDPAAFNKLLL